MVEVLNSMMSCYCVLVMLKILIGDYIAARRFLVMNLPITRLRWRICSESTKIIEKCLFCVFVANSAKKMIKKSKLLNNKKTICYKKGRKKCREGGVFNKTMNTTIQPKSN